MTVHPAADAAPRRPAGIAPGRPAAPRRDAEPDRRAAAARVQRLADCLTRAQAGDRSGLDEIVTLLNPLLWHVARAQGLATEDAADVVQTTWLELLRRLDTIRTPSALTAWLVTATRREAWHTNARRRRSQAAEPDVLDAALDPAPPADDRVGVDERHGALWRNYRKLPERCRELLRVVALADRPDYESLGRALGMPRGSIGPTRGRCLAKLRELLLIDPQWSPL